MNTKDGYDVTAAAMETKQKMRLDFSLFYATLHDFHTEKRILFYNV